MTQEDIGQEKKSKHDMFRYTEINYETLNNWQSLLLYLLEQLQRKEYRRYVIDGAGSCYQKIYNKEGYDTHSWKYCMSIEEFVLDSARKEVNFAMWQNLTSSKGIEATRDYLTKYLGSDFDDLKRDRNVFSFTNGIYVAKYWDEKLERYTDKWFEYGKKRIGASVVSCKLFDLVFEYEESDSNWFDIIKNKCPTLMKVMEYQRWSEDVMKWLCILIGRMLYDVGDLDDWQIMIYLLGVGGAGKCFEKGTPIVMYNGKIKEVEKIVSGDQLMGDDSSCRTVLGTNKGYGKMYHVKQVNGDDYVVNGDHILSLKVSYTNGYKKDSTPKNRIINKKYYKKDDVIDISVNDYIKLSNGQKNALVGYKVPVVFLEREVPIDPYIIGLWLGDGHSEGTGFTNQDATILYYLVHKLPEYKCYLQFHPKDTSVYGYRINGTGSKGKTGENFINKTLNKLNLINNKHIPDIYKYNSRENQLKLLAGLLDSDGYYEKNKCCYDFTQKNYTLAKDVEYLVKCLGLSSKVVECEKGCMYKGTKRMGTYYRQTISGNGIEEIPCLIPRKKASPRKQIKNNLHTGIKIEELEEDDFYGFQIDGNQRFLLGDFTVTHNSTIIEHVIKQIYETADVGVLSNNIERKFGLSALHDKIIFIAPEVKEDFCLEQAELQSIVSGESIQINIKHKQAITIKWHTPGAFSGNEVPKYTDNSGSITRRFAIFPFNYKIKKGDGDSKLSSKLHSELSHIIQACNKGYLKTVAEHGSAGIWDILPEEFKISQSAMAENTNSLINFMKSGKLVFGKDLYIREKVFVDCFNKHCRESNLPAHRWTSQFYSSPFSDNDLILLRNTRKQYPNKVGAELYQGNFICGVDIINDIVDEGGKDDDSDSGFTKV